MAPTLPSGVSRADLFPALTGLRLQEQGVVAVGGMGTIVQAYDPMLQRHVAVKVMHPDLASAPGEYDAFLREARLTARLEHPNIVPVHEATWDHAARSAGFSMKFVNGSTLTERIRQLGVARLGEQELPNLLQVILKVCDAVSFAHSEDVLHLDLKPDNIMIGAHGQVYVMDWGIAVRGERDVDGRVRIPPGQLAALRGTPAYMAPEQLRADTMSVDERADVYALAGILYEVLSGRAPFDVQGQSDLQPARSRGEPAPLLEADGVPPSLIEAALRGLSADPDARQESVARFKADIEQFLRGGGWFGLARYGVGDVIIREGDVADAIYVITDGECDVVQERDGVRAVIGRVQAGDIVGEAALGGGSRTASVIATTPVSARVITRSALDRELDERGWLGVLIKQLAHRFRQVDDARAKLRTERAG